MKIAMFISLIMSFMLYSCNSGDKEVIILPKDYRGYIVIIYNQEKGNPTKYEDGKRIYEIPSDGILKTQFKGNYGLRDLTQYYFEQVSPNNKIPSYVEFNKIPPNGIAGLIGANGNANKDYEGKQTAEYSFYYIGTKTDIEKEMKQAEKLDIVNLAQ